MHGREEIAVSMFLPARFRHLCRKLVLAVAATALLVPVGCSSPGPTGGSSIPSTKASSAVRAVPNQLLPAGTYSSEIFKPPVTYTVPAGWKMFEDEPGQFGLGLGANEGPCVCIWRDVRAAAIKCVEEPEPGVSGSAADITRWLAQRKGLKTTKPAPVEVSGLTGYMIDVNMDPAWRGQCQGAISVPILVGTGLGTGVFWGSDADSSQRIYLLDLGKNAADGNIAILIQVCCGVDFVERTTAATPVIKSLVFRI
jgi:hypothetical protein